MKLRACVDVGEKKGGGATRACERSPTSKSQSRLSRARQSRRYSEESFGAGKLRPCLVTPLAREPRRC